MIGLIWTALIWAVTKYHITGDPITVCVRKLKRLKSCLKEWSRSTFGDIFIKLEAQQQELLDIQCAAPSSDQPSQREAKLLEKINDTLKAQHILMSQKSHCHWLTNGDRNLAFFHRALQVRKGRSSITSLVINGVICKDIQQISSHLQEFYISLFRGERVSSDSLCYIENLIQSIISPEQNIIFTSNPTEAEVKMAIFDLSPDSAPGPDGFGGQFFQASWDIVKHDIVNVAGFFFPSKLIPA